LVVDAIVYTLATAVALTVVVAPPVVHQTEKVVPVTGYPNSLTTVVTMSPLEAANTDTGTITTPTRAIKVPAIIIDFFMLII
jgi:hypothetical protein